MCLERQRVTSRVRWKTCKLYRNRPALSRRSAHPGHANFNFHYELRSDCPHQGQWRKSLAAPPGKLPSTW